jgi:hypothetical protein
VFYTLFFNLERSHCVTKMSHIFLSHFDHESIQHYAHFIGMLFVQFDVVRLFITCRVNRCDLFRMQNVFDSKQVILCE